ncbi:flagellar type III secretion system pore protein FliP [uncultured Fretibacterium sp.]|uniref:flagellar type III secretion system pore protein FliP n=1 Tax=uncultured Fretibacterium sp. TaxID=1678694 RepID=UPI002609134F|nr:flagellar type III secretion system pore protein FliP [uncultured Fretibacterium sp.]
MRIGCVQPKRSRLSEVGRGSEPVLVLLLGVLVVLFLPFLFLTSASAAEVGSFSLPSLRLGIASADSPADVALSLQILGLLTVLSLAPAILLMVTSFTRIVIVLGFVQRAIGLQQSPPQQVVTGLALFLTLFTMYPTWNQVYENGLAPYLARDISAEQAWQRTVVPVREFLFRYTRQEELSLMTSMAKLEQPASRDQVPTRVLVPAFMLSELKTAFQMGVVIYIPFIVVDMVVSSVLLAMGMMMLPPMMVSLPFKLVLFVMADGWNLVVMSLLKSFTNVP